MCSTDTHVSIDVQGSVDETRSLGVPVLLGCLRIWGLVLAIFHPSIYHLSMCLSSIFYYLFIYITYPLRIFYHLFIYLCPSM